MRLIFFVIFFALPIWASYGPGSFLYCANASLLLASGDKRPLTDVEKFAMHFPGGTLYGQKGKDGKRLIFQWGITEVMQGRDSGGVRVSEAGSQGGVYTAQVATPDGTKIAVEKEFILPQGSGENANREVDRVLLSAELARVAGEKKLGPALLGFRIIEDSGVNKVYLYSERVGSGKNVEEVHDLEDRTPGRFLTTPEAKAKYQKKFKTLILIHPDSQPANLMWERRQDGSIELYGVDWTHPTYGKVVDALRRVREYNSDSP